MATTFEGVTPHLLPTLLVLKNYKQSTTAHKPHTKLTTLPNTFPTHSLLPILTIYPTSRLLQHSEHIQHSQCFQDSKYPNTGITTVSTRFEFTALSLITKLRTAEEYAVKRRMSEGAGVPKYAYLCHFGLLRLLFFVIYSITTVQYSQLLIVYDFYNCVGISKQICGVTRGPLYS